MWTGSVAIPGYYTHVGQQPSMVAMGFLNDKHPGLGKRTTLCRTKLCRTPRWSKHGAGELLTKSCSHHIGASPYFITCPAYFLTRPAQNPATFVGCSFT
jgi:hypothetical protein